MRWRFRKENTISKEKKKKRKDESIKKKEKKVETAFPNMALSHHITCTHLG